MTADETTTSRHDAAAHRDAYLALPLPGSPAYWRRLETGTPSEALPIEVLALGVRERFDAGQRLDAHRVFSLIVGRVQRQVMAWSAKVAALGAGAQRQHVRTELVQECYLELWRILTTSDIAYWAESFGAAMVSLQSHTAHACMERWGFWRRVGVNRPRRAPARELESLDAPPRDGDASGSLAATIADPAALRAFERADYLDVVSHVRALSPAQRAVIYGRYWQDKSQQEIADAQGIGKRAVRVREQRALEELRVRLAHHGGLT